MFSARHPLRIDRQLSSTTGEHARSRVVEIVDPQTGPDRTPTTLAAAIARLTVAEDTLRAIGAGEVDAFVISDDVGRRVCTLATADRLYRMFVENMSDGAATLSSGGLILYANQRLAELLSCSRDTIVGAPLARFAPIGLEQIQGALEAGTTELDLVDSNGVAVPVRIGSSPLEVDGDRLTCLTFTDLRNQNALEQQLRQAQKMEAVGRLAGGIAHDFNNIIAVIRGYSGMMLRSANDEKSQRAIVQIDRAAEQGAELTAQLLAYGRQQVIRAEVSDMNDVVEKTLGMLDRLLGDDIVLESRLDPQLASILVDRSQLSQVVVNLAVNAREAMPDGGRLAIETQNAELDADYAAAHSEVVAGRYALLQVTDTGNGMNDETLGRIFDPFFTTKAAGTGLGLSTVFGIVKQNGGHIGVYSEPGIGTTFKVYFQATNAPIVPAVPPREVGSLRGSETILLVEDHELLRPIITEILESYGYTVMVAANGPEALELASREQGSAIELLVTDVVMPGMNGREVAEKLTVVVPELRVLFTSGYPSDTIIRHGIAAGRTAFIQKPFLADDLARKVREMLTSTN